MGTADDTDTNPEIDAATASSATNLLMAAERTLLSWIRTSFSMISFGFALSKFLEYLHAAKPGAGDAPLLPYVLGIVLVAGGALLLVFADREFLAMRRRLLPMMPPDAKRYTLAPTVGGILAALGVALIIALIVSYGEASRG